MIGRMRFLKLKTIPAIIAAMACATACSDKNANQHLAAAKAFIQIAQELRKKLG